MKFSLNVTILEHSYELAAGSSGVEVSLWSSGEYFIRT